MASYQGINSVLAALETYFKERMPSELTQGSINASVKLLGSGAIGLGLLGQPDGPRVGEIYRDDAMLGPGKRKRIAQGEVLT